MNLAQATSLEKFIATTGSIHGFAYTVPEAQDIVVAVIAWMISNQYKLVKVESNDNE